jgi:hypothetical protein
MEEFVRPSSSWVIDCVDVQAKWSADGCGPELMSDANSFVHEAEQEYTAYHEMDACKSLPDTAPGDKFDIFSVSALCLCGIANARHASHAHKSAYLRYAR